MRAITFKINSTLSYEQQDAVLSKISSIPGIEKVASFKPSSKNLSLRRLCFLQVSDAADIDLIIQKLSSFPEIESTQIPVDRYLL